MAELDIDLAHTHRSRIFVSLESISEGRRSIGYTQIRCR